MHRDIKAENMIFKDINCQTLKIIDFGYGQTTITGVTGIKGSPH